MDAPRRSPFDRPLDSARGPEPFGKLRPEGKVAGHLCLLSSPGEARGFRILPIHPLTLALSPCLPLLRATAG